MLIGLSDDPPEILTKSPYKEGLLYFARNEPLEKVRDDGCSRSRKTPMDPEVFHWEKIIGSMFCRSLDRARSAFRWTWIAFRSSRMDTKSFLAAPRGGGSPALASLCFSEVDFAAEQHQSEILAVSGRRLGHAWAASPNKRSTCNKSMSISQLKHRMKCQ